MALSDIFKKIKGCNKCGLRAGCKQVVPGEGPEDSKVVCLGEGPGADEDELGRPFVGRSGDLLRLSLLHANLKDTEVTIINSVCCRPPENRTPTFEETDTCWPWIDEILNAVKPKVIVTLGRPALGTLAQHYNFSKEIKQLGITKLAGKPIYLKDRKIYVYPIIHPAYVLRGNLREDFTGYFQFLGRALPGWLARD